MWSLDLGERIVENGVRFRVWAPKAETLEVVWKSGSRKMKPDQRGYHSLNIPDIHAGELYSYRIDDQLFPDPCSRFQPDGPHGPSMIIDPNTYEWQDRGWQGVEITGQVIYEVHIGTFTREGTFLAAAKEIKELSRIGITTLEIMPVADFPGRWNWGYDGVNLFAPSRAYGTPDDFRYLVDEAHRNNIAVILDVVYNHLGPDGNYLAQFSDHYFTDRYETDWGAAINFDGKDSAEVRELFIDNACYWIHEFHMDGLRLDATQNIYDKGDRHILAEIAKRTREVAAPRKIILIAENEPQHIRLIQPAGKGGYGLDSMWNDDYHHSAMVALTGRAEAYYTDYRGEAQEFISCLKRGFLYQGQNYKWQKQCRGSAVTNEPATAFVHFLQNHDQVANSLYGLRAHQITSPGKFRALTALTLLGPETPFLFMGQEFCASSPFLFFVDHNEDLRPKVHAGRKEFLAQFPSFATQASQDAIPDPSDEQTFQRSKLDLAERQTHEEAYILHEHLLRLRREDVVLKQQRRDRIDGAALNQRAFVIRYFGTTETEGDRLLLINLDGDLEYNPAPEPLLAPVTDGHWRMIWSSDDPQYGGPGAIDPCEDNVWFLPGESAIFLTSL